MDATDLRQDGDHGFQVTAFAAAATRLSAACYRFLSFPSISSRKTPNPKKIRKLGYRQKQFFVLVYHIYVCAFLVKYLHCIYSDQVLLCLTTVVVLPLLVSEARSCFIISSYKTLNAENL